MDYLAKFYKNQSEVLTEQIKFLENELNSLMEDAPASIFRGTGSKQQAFSDSELEDQMRRFKKSSIFKSYSDDEQSQEYKDAKAELDRRRGEQRGPVGFPSAVPTRTEVQRTQRVADETGLPTALPTNTRPGTMSMMDMDGNPIAVQPKAKKPSAAEFNDEAPAKQEATEQDFDVGGEYKYSGGYAQSPTSWSNRYPSKYEQPKQKPAMSPKDFNQTASVNQQAMDVVYDDGGDYNYSADGYAQSPTRWRERYPGNYEQPAPNRFMPPKPSLNRSMFDTETKSLYTEKPTPSLAPRSRGGSYINEPNPSIKGPAINPNSNMQPSDIRVVPPSPIENLARSAAFGKPAVQAPSEDDFSSFWKERLSGGDVKTYMRDSDLEDMMRQNKKTNMFGPAVSDDKQTKAYRAAKAELKRRGKIK
jgi:hypothetical protein